MEKHLKRKKARGNGKITNNCSLGFRHEERDIHSKYTVSLRLCSRENSENREARGTIQVTASHRDHL